MNINKKLSILFLSFLLSIHQLTLAQSYLVHTYNENDGLSNSTVYDVAQDHRGQMWFATRAGISVYNGNEWLKYSVRDGLAATSYCKIQIDEKGIIWALSHAPTFQVSFFENNQWTTLAQPKLSVNINNFSSFKVCFINQKCVLFIGTDNAGCWIFVDGLWKQITTTQGLLSNQINGMVFHGRQIFLATEQGLSIIEGEQVISTAYEKINLPSKRLVGIAIENISDNGDHRLWLHGQNWIGFIVKMKFHLFSNQVQTILDNQNHYVLLQPDLQNGIYYGNVYDIYHLEQQFGPIERLGRISGLITEGVTSFLIDREKNLWITSFRGVSKIQSLRFRNYRKDHGLLQNEVTAIAEIEPGKLVFGHENGLTFFTRNMFHTLSFVKDKSDSEVRTRVLDLKVDPDKNIWIAASMLGLARINTKGKIDWFRQNAGLEGIITSILIDQQGKLWVADQQGLHQYNGKKFTYPNSQPLSFSSRRSLFPTIRKLFPGPANSIYIATSGDGIFLYSGNQWYHYVCTQIIQANNVYFILNDSQSRLWIGTLAGLFILQNNQIVKYQQDNFEIDRPVYLIIEDLKGRLWFGTDNGVIRWDETNKKSFTVQEGFVGQETNRAAGLTDRLGHVWIGSDLGVSKYQEKFDYTQNELSQPLIEFTYLDVIGKKLPLDKVNNLNYQQNTLIFHFQGISFIDEKSLRYRYQLQGYDLDWHFLKNPTTPEIRYTNLSPGKYKFQIQVMNNADCSSAVKSSEWIVIETPFWNTYWFNTIWILTLITILSGSYILRITFLKKKQMAQQIFSRKLLAEIENGRRQIANELHDGLGQNLLVVKNEIQRCLNLQSRSVECTDELKEIDWLLIESINELREISYNLHPHQIERLGLTTAIESSIEKLIKSTTLQIEYQIDKIDNLLPKELEIHIFRIIQEASNNIIKHAKANQVRIQIKYVEQMLKLGIQDDGCGFDSKNYFLTQSRQTGLGLSGIAERVKILTGEFQIFSAPGKGTKLKITIPIRGQPNVNNN